MKLNPSDSTQRYTPAKTSREREYHVPIPLIVSFGSLVWRASKTVFISIITIDMAHNKGSPRNILAATNKVYPSVAFALAASCRLSRFNVFRLNFPAWTAASPYLVRSSRGATLWSRRYQRLAGRVLSTPYAKNQLAIRKVAAWLGTGVSAARRPIVVSRELLHY